MKLRWKSAPRVAGGVAAALVLTLMASRASAQASGPISVQSLFFDQAANARRGNYLEADAGAIYTDNVLLQPNGRSDTLALLGLVGTTSREGPRLDYRVASDIALVKYLHSEFQTQPFGYFDGAADLRIVPGIFSWVARETYTQAVITPLQPITPDNLESINYVTTGPRLTLRPTLRTSIVVDGTYSYVDSSSKSPLYVNISNHRYGGDIAVSRAFSNTLSAYIAGSSEKVEFTDHVFNTNFRQDEGFAGLRFSDARTLLDLSGGYVRVHETTLTTLQTVGGTRESTQNQTPSGTTWRVELSRVISPSQRVSLHALKEVTNAADLFRLNIDTAVPTSSPNQIISGQPFTDREYGATWRFQASRSSLQVDLLDVTQHYQATPLSNREAKLASALFTRQLSPVLSWDIGANYERDVYVSGNQNTVNAITSLRWHVGPRVGLRLIYAHSTLSPHGYTENQVGITASYALTTPGTAGAQPEAQPSELPGLRPYDPISSQQLRLQ